MYEAANVEPLWNVVRSLSGNLDRLRHLHLPMSGKAAKVIAQHQSILDAISKADVVAAEAAVRTHLSGTLANLDEIRSRHANYLLENSR
jgi:DNA-binding GntR family transcriptional regulator